MIIIILFEKQQQRTTIARHGLDGRFLFKLYQVRKLNGSYVLLVFNVIYRARNRSIFACVYCVPVQTIPYVELKPKQLGNWSKEINIKVK